VGFQSIGEGSVPGGLTGGREVAAAGIIARFAANSTVAVLLTNPRWREYLQCLAAIAKRKALHAGIQERVTDSSWTGYPQSRVMVVSDADDNSANVPHRISVCGRSSTEGTSYFRRHYRCFEREPAVFPITLQRYQFFRADIAAGYS